MGIFVDQGYARKHPERSNCQYSRVERLYFIKRLTDKCKERDDPWPFDIMERINLLLNDFVAEEVLQHRVWHRSLYNNSEKPETSGAMFSYPPQKKLEIGKTDDIQKMEVLKFAINYKEENDETSTLDELYHAMKEKSGLSDANLYSTKQMLVKKKKHYVGLSRFYPPPPPSPQQATVVTLVTNLKGVVHNTHTNAFKDESSIEAIIKDIACYIRASGQRSNK